MKQYNHYTEKDFTIVICAYKECEYLEESIKAIKGQTVVPNILLSTSTPNAYIEEITKRHNIPVVVNPNGGQVKDYNFALSQIKTPIGMLAHQDDILNEKFVEKNLYAINHSKDPIIAFSDYREIHNDVIVTKPSPMIIIKNILLLPLRMNWVKNMGWGKRLCQRFGDPITHPSVVCIMDKIPSPCFEEQYHACMDWDLWERLSHEKGSFVYVKDILLYHRMTEENQTVKLFQSGEDYRYKEELEIFCRFWPGIIARFIMRFYKLAEKFY